MATVTSPPPAPTAAELSSAAARAPEAKAADAADEPESEPAEDEFVQKGDEGEYFDTDLLEAGSYATGLVHFSNRICPFAHRTWLVLELHGAVEGRSDQADYRYVHVNLGETKPAEYKAQVNRDGTVPFALRDGRPAYESLVIAEMYDEIFGGRDGKQRLLPDDAFDRAQIRVFLSKLNFVRPLYGLLMAKTATPDELEQKRAAADAAMDELEAAFAEGRGEGVEGPFYLGQTITLADTNILPFLVRFAATLPHYRNFQPLQGRPRLSALLAAAREIPAFVKTTPAPEFFIRAYQGYAVAK